MALSIPEKIAQVAEHFAAHSQHGYSQPNRGTGSAETITLSDGTKVTISNSDVDCSEMVRQCVNAAMSGSYKKPITYMWTGNQDEQLKAQGFTRTSFSASKVRRGDVLLVSGHTGVAVGNGKQADAHGDEYGGINGPSRGDQTGHEVEVRSLRSTWTYIYRYAGSDSGTTSDKLAVDGVIGPVTIREWQRQLGTYVDGVVSGQLKDCQTCYPALTAVTFEGTGSPMMKLVQKKVGVPNPKGIIASGTVAMLQGWLYLNGYSCAADKAGKLGTATAKALQQSLNDGKWS